MSGLLSHRFVSAVADGPDASQVQPSNWNDTHVFSGGNHGAIPVRDTGDAVYGGNWLASVAAGQVLVSNGVGATPSWAATPVVSGLTLNGGILTVNGVGPHGFSATANATNVVGIHNYASAPLSAAALVMDNDVRTSNLTLRSTGSAYNDGFTQDGVTFRSNGAGGLAVVAQHASGPISFWTAAGGLAQRWTIQAAGHLVPTGAMNIGSLTEMVNRIYVSQANPIYAPNMTPTTGTAVILSAQGYLQTLTSSARDKEHLDPWVVPPDALTRFVALAPQLWDYHGQQDGAGGFLAEDLDALAIHNPYGRSVLVNYDADGRPVSNRDFALIALQHLVLQQHAARLAALEAAR